MKRKVFNDVILTTQIGKGVYGNDTILFGFAVLDTVDGEAYYDLDGDHISADVLVAAAEDYARYSRVVLYEHDGHSVGTARFVFPLTEDIADDLGLSPLNRTGLLVGLAVDKAMVALLDEGRITGFSIGGYLTRNTDGEVELLYIDEISLVERPAQEPATVDSQRGGEEYEGGGVEKHLTVRRVATLEKGYTISRDQFPVSKDLPMTQEERAALEAAEKSAKDAKEALEKAEVRIVELEAQVAAKAEDTEKSAPEVVYKSLDGDVFTANDDARLVNATKRADELRMEKHLKEVPSIPEAIAKAVIRSGDEDAIKAMGEHQKAMGVVLKSVTTGTRSETGGTGRLEAAAKSYADEHKVSIDSARLYVMQNDPTLAEEAA